MSAGTVTQNPGPPARTTGPNNKKPFVYEEYVERKHKIQQAIEKRNKKWDLPKNFAKFQLSEDFHLSPKDLLDVLIKAIGENNKNTIKTFCPGQTPSCWLIAFDSKESKERILQSNPMILQRQISYPQTTAIHSACNSRRLFEDHNQVQSIIGANFITNEIKAFFQLCGHQSKCNICQQFGHQSKTCLLKDLRCAKCKKRGHVDSES